MKSAVLVIDVQRGLFDPEPFEANQVVERINTVTQNSKISGCPVFFIQHETENEPLEYGSENWQLHQGLVVNDEDIKIRKTTPDSFLRTNLEEMLNSNKIKNLIICGYASEFCVDTTVRRAAALGFTVFLVSDAHTTHDKEHTSAAKIREHHNCTLPNISSFGPKISAVTSNSIDFGGSSQGCGD
ncbi:MAG: cysteine hydrolase family protein [Desulfobacteraceae bacterium]|jgi:nicotinamidase-related amidase